MFTSRSLTRSAALRANAACQERVRACARMDGFCNGERAGAHLGRRFRRPGITQLFRGGAIKGLWRGLGDGTDLYNVLARRARQEGRWIGLPERGDPLPPSTTTATTAISQPEAA